MSAPEAEPPKENMQVKLVKNDMIDEEIDLDQPEDVPQQTEELKNELVDEVHHISDDSREMHVPSPEDSQNNVQLDDNEMNLGGGLQKEEDVWMGYNPSDYQNLNISPEVASIFKYITDYKPEVIDIDTQLKPFIPEYIPAVGEVDAMLKIPRPDNEHERLGLEILDEPKLNQSKKAVLDLKIAEYGLGVKKKDYKEVHSIENAHKNTRQITDWVKNVEEIIANRHAAVVIYTNKMPEIDDLMQAWDPEFEESIKDLELPEGDIDIPLEDFVRYACALLDIPVHKFNKDRNLIESLHVMFTLYSGFKANQHFQENNYQPGDVHSLQVS